MAAEERAPGTAQILQSLKRSPFFARLPMASLEQLATRAEIINAEAGTVLFRQGDAPDSVYVLRVGALAVLRDDAADQLRRVASIFAGETVGEMGLLTGDARTATIICQRDCELIRLSREVFDDLLATAPQVASDIARVLARRLARMDAAAHKGGSAREPGRPKVFALITHQASLARASEFAAAVAGALGGQGRAALRSGSDPRLDRQEFHDLETAHDFIVLSGAGGDADWQMFCCRQADTILLAADAAAEPSVIPLPSPPSKAAQNSREVILFGKAAPGAAARWLDLNKAVMLHRADSEPALARFARLAARRAVSIVLGGGGARGFAHIGVIHALHEAGIAIDIFGGSSMGAVIAASYAMGWSQDVIEARMRRAFVEEKLLKDPAFPVVSLFHGRRVHGLIDAGFGGFDIEDLPFQYFCVSTDLTEGRAAFHWRGNLANWLKASTAIPGVLPPFISGDTVHVDGGVVDSVPIAGAKALGRGPIIAIDVAGENTGLQPSREPVPLWQTLLGARQPGQPTIAEIMWRVGTIGNHDHGNRAEWQDTIAIRPPVGIIGLLEWRGFDRAVAAGYDFARLHIEANPDVFEGLKV